mmetsp:Transcript_8503/g.26655  ORF Transcript_8503/g.26655 Transcript_8503/m.26655 type:complete len:126 (+) Transcript_8503:27-404(+)
MVRCASLEVSRRPYKTESSTICVEVQSGRGDFLREFPRLRVLLCVDVRFEVRTSRFSCTTGFIHQIENSQFHILLMSSKFATRSGTSSSLASSRVALGAVKLLALEFADILSAICLRWLILSGPS